MQNKGKFLPLSSFIAAHEVWESVQFLENNDLMCHTWQNSCLFTWCHQKSHRYTWCPPSVLTVRLTNEGETLRLCGLRLLDLLTTSLWKLCCANGHNDWWLFGELLPCKHTFHWTAQRTQQPAVFLFHFALLHENICLCSYFCAFGTCTEMISFLFAPKLWRRLLSDHPIQLNVVTNIPSPFLNWWIFKCYFCFINYVLLLLCLVPSA